MFNKLLLFICAAFITGCLTALLLPAFVPIEVSPLRFGAEVIVIGVLLGTAPFWKRKSPDMYALLYGFPAGIAIVIAGDFVVRYIVYGNPALTASAVYVVLLISSLSITLWRSSPEKNTEHENPTENNPRHMRVP